ncbi:MAG: class I SAM-dependent methyltransferase [Rubrobacteraceae bacterium]
MHESNRVAWDEAAARYAEEVERDVELLRSGGNSLLEPELRHLQSLDRWCGHAVHLQCAAGRDTLSLLNLGAGEVVGIDISGEMIELARRKSEALSSNAGGTTATFSTRHASWMPQQISSTRAR